MDVAERNVLRRRKLALSPRFQVTALLLADLKAAGLLTGEMIQFIELERSMPAKANKLFDTIISINSPETFATFVFTLATHNQIMSRDLQSDLRVERGEVHPDEETLEEASMSVHMKFGTSKRFSETDKKDIAELIATKLTVAREEWDRDYQHLHTQYTSEQNKVKCMDDLARKSTIMLRDFVKRHETELTTHAHELITTSDVLSKLLNDSQKSMMAKFYDHYTKFLDKMSTIMQHRNGLLRERAKCMKIMKVKDEEAELDKIIQPTNIAPQDESAAVLERDRTIKRLNKKVSDLEAECDHLEQQLEKLTSQVKTGKRRELGLV